MTREKEIEQAMKDSVAETIYASGWGATPQATDLLECAFTKGAEWADKHPNPKIIKRVLLYALQHTNILLADDWDKVRWNLLIKKAMEE
jgi:hypothetical protein